MTSVLQFERALLSEAESMTTSTVTGMQTTISQSLLDEVQGRHAQRWGGSWPPDERLGEIIGSESMLTALRERATDGVRHITHEATTISTKNR